MTTATATGPPHLIQDHPWVLPSIFVALLLALVFHHHAFSTDVPTIPAIPTPPGSLPFYGHLKALGHDHPTRLQTWSLENNWPLLQAKFGNRRVIVLNSYAVAQHFIVKNAGATVDRPVFWTFHRLVSGSQGLTIGTSPWDISCKRKRTAVGTYMTRPAIQRNAPLIDIEALGLVEDMFLSSLGPTNSTSKEIDPRIFFLRASLNFVTNLCYAHRFADIDDPLLHEILETAHAVSTFRSTNNNTQDYVPFHRYLPNPRMKLAKEITTKRDVWLQELLDRVQRAVDAGKPVSCISEGLLRDKSSEKLSEAEIRSINVGLVSGGFETVATTGIAGLGFLSSPQGQEVQQKAYDAIMRTYGSTTEAWEKCVVEENVEYVVALVREMLRYYCAIMLLPPRKTTKEFEWQGAVIPKGVTVYMNAQAINHDPSAYGPDAHLFRPERWLEPDDKFKFGPPYHFSYGAGSRACTAINLSNRILYAIFVRLIIHFKFTASKEKPPVIDYIDFNENRTDASVLPKRFRVVLEERAPREEVKRNFERSKEATSNMVFS
ncbi:phenylacetate 2-hydroxylase [Saccharata proteae CBS 121410]|uniref:Phenylacetate 2-hydroxylase n=1 Tax=Saccharata proteae CBS 121410 TaxID=1314787 RepID=A0A9P4HXT5_9PEZI|nr:phenylacetate 2-hydroxylase [Saccharata proteae CBS 121410]